MAEIGKYCKGAEAVKELSDADGIYLFEAGEPGQKTGGHTLYVYQRKGDFQAPGNNYQAEVTTIEVLYYRGAELYSAENLADYDDATGEWVQK